MPRPIRKYVGPDFDDLVKGMARDLRDAGADVSEHTLTDAMARSFRRGGVPIIVIQPSPARGRPRIFDGGFSL